MFLKKYFTGKTGTKFWINIVLMVCLIVAVPVVTFYMLDSFTHHGEKIEVPSVVGKSVYDAESMLTDRGLKAMVVDSIYDKYAPKGSVLDQSPKAGFEVKGGRVVYLTVNLKGAPMAQLPEVEGSLRQTEALLLSLGFKLTSNTYIMGQPKDLVIGVKQGLRDVHTGENIPRDRPLTLIVGGGEPADSIFIEEPEDSLYGEENMGSGDDFDIEL